MLNQIVLVGRIASNGFELKNLEDDKKMLKMVLAIPRSFKNENGEYETDFIDVVLYNTIAETTFEYCKKGDIVGVKGRLQSKEINKYHTKIKELEVIAEKVTFLSSGKGDNE